MVGSVVILTGAGISKESGLETFRDPDGISAKVRIEDVATPEAFRRDPVRVQAFYNMRRVALLDPALQPNAAHLALARLEQTWAEQDKGSDFLLVTQNIDDLHERAGSQKLLHMHGEILKTRCLACGAAGSIRADLTPADQCPQCGTAGTLRPDVVWFGEMPYQMDRIYLALSQADLFVSIGTSGNVYPAAGFVEMASRAGARTVELNLEPSMGTDLFEKSIQGAATDIVPKFVEELLRG